MSDLIDVIDASKPPDPSVIPAGTRVVMGYVGGEGMTPYVWTPAEAKRYITKTCTWWPIYTVPESALSALDGSRAASAMSHALDVFPVHTGTPVFLDVEHVAIRDSPEGAAACIEAWTRGMRAAGYLHVYAYADPGVGGRWLPRWVTSRPQSLPLGIVGWQWQGSHDHPAYDCSVFDPSLLDVPHDPPPSRHAPNGKAASYLVKNGDTLSGIGRRYHVSWQAIYAANRQEIGSNPNLIHAGQVLHIPGAYQARTYTVRPGDSLVSISGRFGVDWHRIYDLNRRTIGSNPNLIRPGQVLVL